MVLIVRSGQPRSAALVLVAPVIIAVIVAGCLAAGPGGGAGSGDAGGGQGSGGASDDAPLLGPYAFFLPGVEELGGGFIPGGGAMGIVWDLADGAPLEGAQVVAQCVFFDFPFPLGPSVSVTDDLGRFDVQSTAFLATCDEVVYDALAPGYAMDTPLKTGPLDPQAQYLVKIGMRAAY